MMLAKRRLQRGQTLFEREALDGDHLRALGLNREHQTRPHRGAVDQHGAGAAHAMLAADMGSGQPQMMAQAIGERQPRLDFDLDRFAVDLEPYWHAMNCYAAALRNARSTMTPTSALR
jgi:hypothetical protein